MTDAPKQNKVKRTLRWLAPALALAATLPVTLGASSASAEVDEAQVKEVSTIDSIAPGETVTKTWKHADQTAVYTLDVMPVPAPLSIGVPCVIEPTRMWKTAINYFDQPTDLTVHWEIKNVGSSTCGAVVRLGKILP